jgi:general secretion pathway protein I
MNKNIYRRILTFCPRGSSDGFTLMETLVAMMLLAISLVVILQLFSGGLKSGKMADDYTRAIFHAREKMEEYLLTDDFQEGTFEGTFDDKYRWQVDIKFLEPKDEEETLLIDLFHIDVLVFWPSGGQEKKFQISTLKITEKRPDGID